MPYNSDDESNCSSDVANPGSRVYYDTPSEASNDFGEEEVRETDSDGGSEVSSIDGSSEAEVETLLQSVGFDEEEVDNAGNGAEDEVTLICKFCRDNELVCKLARLEMNTKSLKCTNCKVRHRPCTLDFSVCSKNARIAKQEEQYNKGKLDAINDEFRSTIARMRGDTNTSKLVTALKSHITHLEKQLEIKRTLDEVNMAICVRFTRAYRDHNAMVLENTAQLVENLHFERILGNDMVQLNDSINDFTENFNFNFESDEDENVDELNDESS
ncbi:uncharacterized protein UTRI_03016 [Ustilago trichophora]|uniref:Zn(2)-C6 fungal-type domain-containing protein n=1 Tax=Ustilago trichophora TaxID=86804 RepID=A0A5C3E807_9BASI|nr:uncharacterized protein UTRI_03016 [Ustilago trichophora]